MGPKSKPKLKLVSKDRLFGVCSDCDSGLKIRRGLRVPPCSSVTDLRGEVVFWGEVGGEFVGEVGAEHGAGVFDEAAEVGEAAERARGQELVFGGAMRWRPRC